MTTINIYQFNNGQSYWICPICKTPKLGNLNNIGFMGCKHVDGKDFIFDKTQYKTNVINVAQSNSELCENKQEITNVNYETLDDIVNKFLKTMLNN